MHDVTHSLNSRSDITSHTTHAPHHTHK